MPRPIQPSHLLLILLFAWLQFFFSLGDLGLVGPDEPRYAQVAKEMLISGDYVTPRYFGEPWLEKPILYYWLTAAAYFLFGINEFGARLPSALAAALGMICVYFLGRQRSESREGLLACLILASSLLYFSLARAASMDMLLSGALTVVWTSLFFVLFGKEGLCNDSQAGRPGLGRLTVFYAFLGVATLAKGPVGLILPITSLAIFLALTGRLHLLPRLRPAIGLPVLMAVVLPWYGLCTLDNGWLFVEEFLLRHNFERFLTDRYEHDQPLWFFPAVALVGFYPWSLQVLSAGRRLFQSKEKWRSAALGQDLYLWVWFLTPLVFFSLSRSKLPGYLLPAAPAIALLIARQVQLWLRRESAAGRGRWFKDCFFYQALSVLLLGFALPVAAAHLNLPVESLLPQATGLLLGTGVSALLLYWRDHRQWLVTCYFLAVSLSVFFVAHQVFPRVDSFLSSRRLAAFLRQEGFIDQPLYLFGISRNVAYGLSYYLDAKAQIIYSEGEMRYHQGVEAFFITSPKFNPAVFFDRTEIRERSDFQNQTILKVARTPG